MLRTQKTKKEQLEGKVKLGECDIAEAKGYSSSHVLLKGGTRRRQRNLHQIWCLVQFYFGVVLRTTVKLTY